MRVLLLACLAAAAPAALAGDSDGPEYPYKVPLGLEAPRVPSANPMSDAKVRLGKLLFFDKRVSENGQVSCATCHDPKKGWADASAVSTGVHGRKGRRSSPTVLNSAYMGVLLWDGRAYSLEQQARVPIAGPNEMGSTLEACVSRLRSIKGYAPLFERAFGSEGIDIDRVAKALAAFERTLLSGNAPFDKWRAGDENAMSESAIRGHAIFHRKGECAVCHAGFNFSDSSLHNLGVGMGKGSAAPDLGVFEVTKDEQHMGKFRTPTLRNLELTAPYMHDGSLKTLAEVVDFFDRGGGKNPHLDHRMRPLGLTAEEKSDLVAFLDALNGDRVVIEPPKLPD